jgi:hypothetical protein
MNAERRPARQRDTPVLARRKPQGHQLPGPGPQQVQVLPRRRGRIGHERRCLGSSRAKTASTARSAQPSLGLGCWRRSTATSCRSTSSSASLDADDRASSAIHPASRPAGRTSDTASVPSQARDPVSPPAIMADVLAGQLRMPSYGTPHVQPLEHHANRNPSQRRPSPANSWHDTSLCLVTACWPRATLAAARSPRRGACWPA